MKENVWRISSSTFSNPVPK